MYEESTTKHLNKYEEAGLQTLPLAYKNSYICLQNARRGEHSTWNEKFFKAKTSIRNNKDGMLKQVSNLGNSHAFAEDTSTAKRRKISGNEEDSDDDKSKKAQVFTDANLDDLNLNLACLSFENCVEEQSEIDVASGFYVLFGSVNIISAIEFDKTGDHLATGNRGGTVVLFERTHGKEHGANRRDLKRMDYPSTQHPEFHYKTEFQSHEPQIKLIRSGSAKQLMVPFFFCPNHKTIKFWKVQEKKVKKIRAANVDPLKGATNGSIASSSVSSSPNQRIPNGGSLDQSYSFLAIAFDS
ncbi:unnamed protein product [Fraxinus pennsylvanica]|uniref:Uncharacterized protein n=1 Tax=Fraxinus pennsylvanica TaxID=56036 RepID=A0AAD1ZZV9_9LAMI|nr:unnamed protein product [Fraxinus pennsylvanica]